MHPRDRVLRDTFTPAEKFLVGVTVVTCIGAFFIGDPRSYWLLGFLLMMGSISPVVLKTHQHTHPFLIDQLWPRFWLLTAPVWIIVAFYFWGMHEPPLTHFEKDERLYKILSPVDPWKPTAITDNSSWLTLLGFSSLYLVAINLFIVPKSRYFYERILPCYVCIAVLVGIWGYFQKMMRTNAALFTNGTGRSDFFAFFPYDGHWAAFALLWSCTGIALAMLQERFDKENNFLETSGPFHLAGATILGASGLIIEARWPSVCLLFTYGLFMTLAARTLYKKKADKHHKTLGMGLGALGAAAVTAAVFRALSMDNSIEHTVSIKAALLKMIAERPLFGWGLDSFPNIVPFFADPEIVDLRLERAGADYLQILAEVGIVGLIFPIGLLIYLVLRYLRARPDVYLTNHMLIGCFAVLPLVVIDSPFMSPAFALSFFIIFFSALRWADLTRYKVDEVDSNQVAVTSNKLRRVPVFDGDYEDVEK